jgi:magnesium transporter
MHLEKVKIVSRSVRRLLRRSAHENAARLLLKLRPGDISVIMQQLNLREQLQLFTLVAQKDRQLAAEALNDLGVERGVELVTDLEGLEISKILQELETDDRAAFITALPQKLAEEVLEVMRPEDSVQTQGLLQYEEETAGRIMTPNIFALEEQLSVGEATQTIQASSDFEMVFYLYVVDDRNHLVGVISLRQLLTVSPSTPLAKIMSTDLISVDTATDQEEVANQVALYDLLAIPVVDHENKLVGVITVDDVIDVIQDEATEDILHLAGVEADDTVHATALNSISKRLPWLFVNLFLALMAASVVYFYEETIGQLPILAAFLPVVAGMGGNSGTQALTVMVRSLALGEVSWKNLRGVFAKEVKVGVSNGLALGLVAGIVGYWWSPSSDLRVGISFGVAMLATIFLSGVLGAIIPMSLNRLKIDPAIASGIFVHTLTDVIAFFSFLGLANFFLFSIRS